MDSEEESRAELAALIAVYGSNQADDRVDQYLHGGEGLLNGLIIQHSEKHLDWHEELLEHFLDTAVHRQVGAVEVLVALWCVSEEETLLHPLEELAVEVFTTSIFFSCDGCSKQGNRHYKKREYSFH